jgi:hypothetical protein
MYLFPDESGEWNFGLAYKISKKRNKLNLSPFTLFDLAEKKTANQKV